MERLGTIIAVVVVVVAIAILLAWSLQLLWNGCLLSAVDGTHPISFWQALGLNLLCGILFRNSNTSKK